MRDGWLQPAQYVVSPLAGTVIQRKREQRKQLGLESLCVVLGPLSGPRNQRIAAVAHQADCSVGVLDRGTLG
jgi:hypothetical protein